MSGGDRTSLEEAADDAPRVEGPKFAMVPAELIIGAPDPLCLRLYAYFDLRQGQSGWPARGAQYVADRLGLQPRTVLEHAYHLSDRGWLKLRNDPRARAKGDAQRQVIFDVVHNPARERVNPRALSLEPPEKKWRSPSKRAGGTKPVGGESEGQDLKPYLIDLDCPAPGAGHQMHDAQDMSSDNVARRAGHVGDEAVELLPVDNGGYVPREAQDMCGVCGEPVAGHTFDHEPVMRAFPGITDETVPL